MFRVPLAVVALAAAPALATDVKIENYTNGTLYVAVAYNHWKGNVAAEGWFAVESNKTLTLHAADAAGMHLRIQTAKAGEVTFKHLTTFRSWAVEPERFLLSKESDDADVRVYNWGANLQHHHNSNKKHAAPAGWAVKRFFEVGNGKHTLKIEPND